GRGGLEISPELAGQLGLGGQCGATGQGGLQQFDRRERPLRTVATDPQFRTATYAHRVGAGAGAPCEQIRDQAVVSHVVPLPFVGGRPKPAHTAVCHSAIAARNCSRETIARSISPSATTRPPCSCADTANSPVR